MSFPRYPKYKDSGIEWLGDLPQEWQTAPLKNAVTLRSGGTPDKSKHSYWDGDVPWASAKDLKSDVICDTQDHITQIAVDSGVAQLEPAGSILVVVRGMILARTFPVTVAAVPIAINQDLKAITPRRGIDAGYLAWLLRGSSTETMRVLDEAAHGTKALRMDAWTSVRIPIPPQDEQRAIASFLDSEMTKIDALIGEQQVLLKLLQEKRQAIITRVVSKGLKPDAPTKPSGVEWMADVPAHWRVLQLGFVTLSRCDGPFGSGLKSEHYTESGVRVVRLQNIRTGGFAAGDAAFIDPEYYESMLNGHDVRAGDLLVAGLGDDNNTVGRACIAPPGIEPAMVKADCFRFRLDTSSVLPEFVALQLSAGASADAGQLSSGSTRSRISLSVMATRRVALPPLQEQRAVLDHVRVSCSSTDAMITDAESVIALLHERRSSLISAAVTGKIDVRNYAADQAEAA